MKTKLKAHSFIEYIHKPAARVKKIEFFYLSLPPSYANFFEIR